LQVFRFQLCGDILQLTLYYRLPLSTLLAKFGPFAPLLNILLLLQFTQWDYRLYLEAHDPSVVKSIFNFLTACLSGLIVPSLTIFWWSCPIQTIICRAETSL